MKALKTAVAVLLLASAALAQSADEIVQRYVAARGGQEKFRAIQTLRYSGAFKLPNGAVAQLSREIKRPNRVRTDFLTMGLDSVRAFDGEHGWQVLPMNGSFEAEPMPASELQEIEDDADLEGPLVGYKQKGHRVELLGMESIEGRPCYRLRVRWKSGRVTEHLIDTSTFLEAALRRPVVAGGAPFEAVFSDYRQVNGVKFPFIRDIHTNGAIQRYAIEKMEANVSLDDARFKMPAKPAAAQPQAPRPALPKP